MNIMNNSQHTLRHAYRGFFGLMALTIVCWTPYDLRASEGGYSSKASTGDPIYAAAQAVDVAWEEFHRSAIEGTLASPTIQAHIEQQLHEARGLVMRARQAGRKGDLLSVQQITNRVIDLSKTIVASSRERKQ
ncbi:hypothetical protein [Nitrospira sp. M1]